MEISIFGFKFRLEILILIVVVYWILAGHLLCSCTKIPILENFLSSSEEEEKQKEGFYEEEEKQKEGFYEEEEKQKEGFYAVYEEEENQKEGFYEEEEKEKEGFIGAINDGESSAYTLGSYNGVIMPTSSWGKPTLDVIPGKPLSKGVRNILNREEQPIPLPEGELNMFETTPFKPECCPNAYSNSSGCACMTVDQYNYLITRGGNNVPYSEY